MNILRVATFHHLIIIGGAVLIYKLRLSSAWSYTAKDWSALRSLSIILLSSEPVQKPVPWFIHNVRLDNEKINKFCLKNFFEKNLKKKELKENRFSFFIIIFYTFRNVITSWKKTMICLFHRYGKRLCWKWP